MSMNFGKAISGGRPLDDEEINNLARDQLSVLRKSLVKKPYSDKTDDIISQRLAEELRLVARMLEMVEKDMVARGNHQAAKQISQSEEVIEDIAEVVEANDKCEAIEHVDGNIGRRLIRRALDGSGTPCDNRRISILKKMIHRRNCESTYLRKLYFICAQF